ncbi:MAG: pyruvoyl-dependent arginine decarboxylase [Thermoproteales archaeon]|nr:pyruvoyl-dependent arginine decarboxylase [Thermoproteales archaeon]
MTSLVPRKYFVVDGEGLSETSKLNAFDNALRNAGIAHLNLVPVSSILPPDAEEVSYVRLPTGAVTFVIMARQDGCGGQSIAAGLAWGKSEKMGYVVEAHGTSAKAVEEKLRNIMKEVEKEGGIKFTNIKTRVKEMKIPSNVYGSVVVVLVLLF